MSLRSPTTLAPALNNHYMYAEGLCRLYGCYLSMVNPCEPCLADSVVHVLLVFSITLALIIFPIPFSYGFSELCLKFAWESLYLLPSETS